MKQILTFFSATKPPKPPGLLEVIWSVLAAAFGVQSSKNHQRDFNQSSPKPYIFAGILFTLIFIAILVFAVQAALKFSN